MRHAVTLTLQEAATILDPPITETQLRQIITALGWKPDGQKRTGKPGHPAPVYEAPALIRLHAALIPFMRYGELARNRF